MAAVRVNTITFFVFVIVPATDGRAIDPTVQIPAIQQSIEQIGCRERL
jgi:hypothetical protein